MNSLKSKTVKVKVDASTQKITQLNALLNSLKSKTVKISVNSASVNSAIQQLKNKLQNINLNANVHANVAGMTIRAAVVNLHGNIHGNGAGGGPIPNGGGLFGGLAAAYGGYFGASQITDSADEMMNLDSRLRIVTKDEQERLDVENELYSMGQRTRQQLASLGKLYFGVARASEEMGFSKEDNLQVTETVSKALAVGGATKAESDAAILQLSQALGSGRLQGDELRSLDENAGALMKHVAAYFGTNVAGLKEMGAQGELTSDKLMRAIMASTGAVSEEFSNMQTTFGQAMTMMKNAWDWFTMTIQRKSGIFSTITQGLAKAFERIGKRWEELANSDFFPKIEAFFDSLDGVKGNLSDQIAGIVEQLLKLGAVFAPVVAGLMAFQGLAFVFEPLVSAASALDGAIAGIGMGLAPLAAMFAGVALAINWTSENWEEAVAMFQPGIDLMIDGVQKFQQAWTDLQPLIQAIQPLVDMLADAIGQGLVQAVANAWNLFSVAFNGMASLAANVGLTVEKVASAVEWLSSALSGAIGKLQEFVGLSGSIGSVGDVVGHIYSPSTTSQEQNITFNINSEDQITPAMNSANTFFAYD